MAILRNSLTWIIAFCVVSSSALLVALVSPNPYKLYGGCALTVCVSAWVLFRALTEVFSLKVAKQLMPCVATAFIILVPIGLFTVGVIQRIAAITFIAIVGIAGFCWIVSAVVKSFMKRGEK
jgi:hypothetical protein